MSKQIDLTQPLTDAEVQYLVDRCDWASIERNRAYLAGLEYSPAEVDPLAANSVETALPVSQNPDGSNEGDVVPPVPPGDGDVPPAGEAEQPK